ncbi:cytidine deaminase-like protein [Pisolithus orientalis]|uniref:cytidine deaminase-like protein n=1 Tax=Pisolithus orientalis TaxID=936130 RepID=UPI002224E843|nr:cytidine deaminase-like protein [Pisolithus orientalis]KAI6028715.1 cytidine deaminase-like protein [Pisolithus orientalis]
MLQALKEASKCEPVQTAFCVGCVLVVRFPDQDPVVLSTGYSRELPGNTHAEANALAKVRHLSTSNIASLFPSLFPTPTVDALLALADVYTTLEPCTVRTSGLPPCADALIQAKVKRCIIGVGEPDDFVKCEGARKLQEAGIEIVWLHDMQTECLAAARRRHIST